MKNDDIEIQDTLLLELKQFNRKFNIAKVLIGLIMITIPIILIMNILGLLGSSLTFVSLLIFLIGLLFSIRMMNFNRMLCKIHTNILDCIINKKPFV